jgi:hypothetical protein
VTAPRKLLLLVVLGALPLSARAWAQPNLAESEAHFDRGLALWDQNDYKGALVELRRSYELNPKPDILYDVAFAHARLGQPVQAVATFDDVLKAADQLPPAKVEQARRARAEQAGYIGQLLVRTNVDAELTLDGAPAGRTPMSTPVAVARGTHWLWVRAEGQAPHVDKVEVVGGQTLEVPINLTPMQGSVAYVVVDSAVPGAEVILDGNAVGRTPLTGPLPVTPGPHELSLRRAGYDETRTSLSLSEGGSRTLTLSPSELTSTEAPTGLVGFRVSEPDATVEIDGKPRPDYRDGLRLPAGVHRLTVIRTGFFSAEREIVSEPSSINTVRVKLEPTEETRMRWVGRATSQQRWAWATVATGAVLGGVATYFFLHNRPELRDANAEHDQVKATLQPPNGECSAAFELTDRCQELVNHANDRLDKAQRTRQLSLIGMGVGGAFLVTGVVLRVLADDPHRYDFERPGSDRDKGLHFLAGVWPGLALVGVEGRFR